MIEGDSVKLELEEIYDPERATAILGQFNNVQKSMRFETIMAQFHQESIQAGWCLEIHERGELLRTVRLAFGDNLVGRSLQCKVHLTSMMASRMHCVLNVHVNGYVTLRDLRSTNHTFVNGVELEAEGRRELHEGESIFASQACIMVLKRNK